jgi:outer membrane lipoprotein-sorting protein
MNETQINPHEDLVTRAVAATRGLPLPTGPSTAVAADTLAALREAGRRPKVALWERITHMSWTMKALAAAAAGLMAAYVGLTAATSGSVAFADVVAAMNKVTSARWKTTTVVTRPSTGPVTLTGVGMFLAPSHERMEMSVLGMMQNIQIVDGEKDRFVNLVPATKRATVIDVTNMSAEQRNSVGKTFDGLRQMVMMAQQNQGGRVKQLGRETIDGRSAVGFQLQLGAIEVKLWADPETMLPLRVEQSVDTGPTVHVVMSDFEMNVELDPGLFSVDVPAGYTIERTTTLDMSKKPIDYLADALRLAAEFNGGEFPAKLRGEGGLDAALHRAAIGIGLARIFGSPENMQKRMADLGTATGGALGMVLSLSDEHDWHYAGKGVKLNDPDRPIFWYKPQPDQAGYQVLYADLSVKEAAEPPQVEGAESAKSK